MYLKHLFGLLICVMLVGCATAGVRPIQSNIKKSKVYNAPYDHVWTAIIAVIAESNLNIATLEKDSGIISISNVTYEPSWANEGTRGGMWGTYSDQVTERVANFNILATRQTSDQTRVQVNSSFKMNIRSGNGSQMFPFTNEWQQAYSNGTLERIVLDGVAQKILLK